MEKATLRKYLRSQQFIKCKKYISCRKIHRQKYSPVKEIRMISKKNKAKLVNNNNNDNENLKNTIKNKIPNKPRE